MEASKTYPNIYHSVKDFIPLGDESIKNLHKRRIFLRYEAIKEKNNATSEMLWKQANDLAEKEQYFEAVIFYTDSIRYAEENTETMLKAYIKRAEALYHLSRHRECVEDFKRANNVEPNNPMIENNKYEQAAKYIVNLELIHDRLLPEPEKKHVWIDRAADSVNLVQSDTGSRYFIANRDIAVGELIAVDVPIAVGVHIDDKLFCHECGINCMNPIPCKKCTIVQYCDTPCRDAAWNKYHKYECLILPTLRDFIEMVALPLKMTLYFLENYNTKEESKKRQKYDPYKEIINLEVDVSKHHEDIFNIQRITGLTFFVVLGYTSFFHDVASKSGLTDEELHTIFRALLLKLLLVKKTYFRTVSKKSIVQGKTLFKGRYDEARTFRSLLKHSCIPNVSLVQIDNALIARAFLPIKKGAPLVIEFCQSFIDVGREVRSSQLSLKGRICSCEACVMRWPEFSYCPPAMQLRAETLEAIEEFIGTKRYNFSVHEKVVVILRNLPVISWEKPSKELYIYFRTARKCFQLLDLRTCYPPSTYEPYYEIEEVHRICCINWDNLEEPCVIL